MRSTLAELQDDLASGSLVIQPDTRLRLLLSGSGRNICVPTCERSICPAPRITRSARGLLSPLYLTTEQDGTTEMVHVPWSAICQNHNKILPAIADNSRASCCKDWPRFSQMGFKSIVFLKLRVDDEWWHGWYVRFSDAPKELVKVPNCRIDMVFRHVGIMRLGSKNFPRMWRNSYFNLDSTDEFHALLSTRFANYRKRVNAHLRAEREGRRDAASATLVEKRKLETELEKEAITETCVVCLEECASAHSRCDTDGCLVKVCDVCHRDSRGCCPLCDRTALNAQYPCSACHSLHPLSKFGYACIACGAHTLCRNCHRCFQQCTSCECK